MAAVRGAASPQETTITLRNTGTVALTNLSARLSGSSSDHFALLSTLSPVLDSGGTVTLTVRFLPEQPVSSFGTALVIDSGEPDIENFMVILRGSTLQPVATLTLLNGAQSVPANGTVDFGGTIAAKPVVHVLTIKNTGNIELQIQGLSLDSSGTPGDFTVGPPETDRLLPGASTTFPVTFTPAGPGVRTARLRIASTDTFNPPLEVNFLAWGFHGLEAWRLTFFDTALNEGPAADLSDPDHDGVPNLLEYATLINPLEPNGPPGEFTVNGITPEYTVTLPSTGPWYLQYDLEWAVSLPGPWTSSGVKPAILSDDGTRRLVKYSLPAGGPPRRFVRLRVSKP
jgi:hypothetical protein